jgi:hypothetical protein
VLYNGILFCVVGAWTSIVYAEHLREWIRRYVVQHAPEYRMKEWTHPLPDVFQHPSRWGYYRYFFGGSMSMDARHWYPVEWFLYPFLWLGFLPVNVFHVIVAWTSIWIIQTLRVCYEARMLTSLGLQSLVLFTCACVFHVVDPGQATELKIFPYFLVFIWLWIMIIVTRIEPPIQTPPKRPGYASFIHTVMESPRLTLAFESYLNDQSTPEEWYFILDVTRFKYESPDRSTTWRLLMLNGLVVSYILPHAPLSLVLSEEDRSHLLAYTLVYQTCHDPSILDQSILVLERIAQAKSHSLQTYWDQLDHTEK